MTKPALTTYIGRFLAVNLKAVPGFATVLPGGIWRGVAPEGAAYPFLTYEYVSGSSKLVVDSTETAIGGNLNYLLKVTDRSESSVKAQDGAAWVNEAIASITGAAVLDGYVYAEETNPYDSSTIEGEVRYQQIGGTYAFYVDRG